MEKDWDRWHGTMDYPDGEFPAPNMSFSTAWMIQQERIRKLESLILKLDQT